MEILGELSGWRVALRSGNVLDVWAHSVSEEDGHYVFGVLARIDGEPEGDMLVTARTPADASRFIVAVARIPIEAVEHVRSW